MEVSGQIDDPVALIPRKRRQFSLDRRLDAVSKRQSSMPCGQYIIVFWKV